MKTIPQVRKRLLEIAGHIKRNVSDELGDELFEMVEDLKRRAPVRRATKDSGRDLTEEVVREVRQYAENFPDMSYMELSVALNVNAGRISEILAGKRT